MPCEAPCNKPMLRCENMKKKAAFFTLAAVLVVSSGCSYIESLFPDKERDYQYTAETPLLNWPSGLRENKEDAPDDVSTSPSSVENSENSTNLTESVPPPITDKPSEPGSQESSASSPAPAVSKSDVIPADENDAQETVSSVEIVKYDDGESRLRLGTGFSKAWRLVNKGLSRNTIEVTDRNHDQGSVTIQYDPDEKKAKDDSFMDEFDFILKGINTNDKIYNLKFEEHGQQTDVMVLNDEHLPLLNDNNALRLLKLLADTIKTDLAKKAK